MTVKELFDLSSNDDYNEVDFYDEEHQITETVTEGDLYNDNCQYAWNSAEVDYWYANFEARVMQVAATLPDSAIKSSRNTRSKKSVMASEIERINHISKIIEDGNETTFFLTTDEESGYWYWIVDTDYVTNYPGTVDDFVNDLDNAGVGSSVAYFDSLEDAVADYYGDVSSSVTASTDSLYNRLLSVVDNPTDDIDTHESDIYVLKTPETTKIIKDYYDAQGLKSQATTFIDNITHRPFYEIPFGYMNELIDKRRKDFD